MLQLVLHHFDANPCTQWDGGSDAPSEPSSVSMRMRPTMPAASRLTALRTMPTMWPGWVMRPILLRSRTVTLPSSCCMVQDGQREPTAP